jgi:hypothetical protein
MQKSGKLAFVFNGAELDGERLAVRLADDPFGTAAEFLSSAGLSDGADVEITGVHGIVDTVPVIFIKKVAAPPASVLTLAAAGSLGGNPILLPGQLACKTCGFVNDLVFLDQNHLPNCQNPAPPIHVLKI